MHVVPPDINPIGPSAGRARAGRRSSSSTAATRPRPLLVEGNNVGAAIMRQADDAQLVVMGATAMTPTDVAQSDGALFGVLPETVAQQAKPTVIVVKTRETLARSDVRAARRAGRDAGGGRSRRRGRPERPGPRRPLVRRVELPPQRVRRPRPPRRAQAEAGPDHQRRAADAQRGGDHRPDRARGARRADGAVPAARRAAGRSTPTRTTTPAQSPSPRARASSSTRTCCRATAPTAARARRSGRASTRRRGDLVAWSDTDIIDWHPRFIYGTLGPLLAEPRIGYVKAYYQRPIVEDGVLKEGGGGRVTELVARPLINLFFPELSGYIQPLAGEYAGRRDAPGADPVLHRLRGRDRPPHRPRRAAGPERLRAGGPRHPRPSQPGARRPLAR